MGRRPSSKPNKGTAPIAPPEGDILGRMFVTLKPENPKSDLNYFRHILFPKFEVTFKDNGSDLVAAIIDRDHDNDHAWRLLRTEGQSERYNGLHRHVSVRRYVPFIDLEDIAAIREQAYKQKMLMAVKELRFHPRNEYPRGGLYSVWDEKECLYVGLTKRTDPAERPDNHFHLDNAADTDFDRHCRSNYPYTASWKICLIDPVWCNDIVRKSLFWDKEEYDRYMARIEDEYSYRVMTQPRWFLLQAERALIALYQPRFNIVGNAHKPL